MSAATVAAVLDRLEAWAEDERLFWQGSRENPFNWRQRCVLEELDRYRLIEAGGPRGMDVYLGVRDLLKRHAIALGWTPTERLGPITRCNDKGGLPAVRALIARAREEASDGE